MYEPGVRGSLISGEAEEHGRGMTLAAVSRDLVWERSNVWKWLRGQDEDAKLCGHYFVLSTMKE